MTTTVAPAPPPKRVPSDPTVEREMAVRAFMRGPAVFLEEGYDREAIQEFLNRPHVIEAFATLHAEYKNEEILTGRARFLAKREMVRDVPAAVGVLRRALAGKVYVRDSNGAIQRDRFGNALVIDEVDPFQMRAAQEIMDRLNVGGKDTSTGGTDVNGSALFASQAEARKAIIQQEAGLTEEQRTIQRERMRAITQALAPQLAEIKKKLALTMKAMPESEARTVKATVKMPLPPAAEKPKKAGRRKPVPAGTSK